MSKGKTTDRLPLHLRIQQDIEGQIRSGALTPGQKIPFEHELMQTYDCARMTVNKALSVLNTAGLIERRKRAGTFVKRPRIDSTVLDIPDIQSEITGRGDVYRFHLASRLVRNAATPDERELVGAGEVLVIRGVHFAGDRPLAVEHRLINLSAVPEARDLDFTDQSPGHWLLQAVPWTNVENQISAINADAVTARLLDAEKGMACLVVERKTWRVKTRVTTVRQVFDGESYQLVARFAHT